MANENYVPQVDYTSRDYLSLKEEMAALIPYFAPNWTNRDPADFGMTLIELFAYMGDQLNYYIDRSLNEAFITTSSQRDNVLKIARLLGYTPTESTAAKVTLTFQNSTGSTITVPKRTQVSTTVVNSGSTTQIIFETDSAVTVPAKVGTTNGSITVTATQGETLGYNPITRPTDGELGVSGGGANQFYPIPDSPVIGGSIDIDVSGVKYSYVPFLIDYQDYDPVFTTYTDAEGTTYVQFGDGISGRIPANQASIKATYRIGGGKLGNVAANTIKFIKTNATIGLTVNNQDVGQTSGAATGGADPETTDSIRINAPKSVRALSRAVSLSDYSNIAIQVPGVAKANSISDVYSSVTIYIAPFGDSGLQSDGQTASDIFNNLASDIGAFFQDKTPPGTSITLQPPAYVDVRLKLDCVVLPQFRADQVTASIREAITELFDFDNVSFNDRITTADVLSVIREVDGVARVSMNKMIRKDEDKVWSINNKVLLNNVATLTTTATHNLQVGETVLVSGVNAPFDGAFVVTAVAPTTFSYSVISTNVSTAAVSPVGKVALLAVKDIICLDNELPQLEVTKVAGITTVAGIDLTTSGGIS
jgi:uncharacterized phage protein gp47/JayE